MGISFIARNVISESTVLHLITINFYKTKNSTKNASRIGREYHFNDSLLFDICDWIDSNVVTKCEERFESATLK